MSRMCSRVVGEEDRKPLVLVRTFCPCTNANYGGLLQAWALQKTISGLGFEVEVDGSSWARCDTRMHLFLNRLLAAYSRFGGKGVCSRWLGVRLARLHRDQRILEFGSSHIRSRPTANWLGMPFGRGTERYSALVAGSDQIWRPSYTRIELFLFGDVDLDRQVPRIAYGASFGGATQDEFDPELRDRTARLARRFSSISVRESSGVPMCQELWHIPFAQVVPDPTLLLQRSAYVPLMAPPLTKRPYLACYFLDKGGLGMELQESLGVALGVDVVDLYRDPSFELQLGGRPSLFGGFSVGEWLSGIDGASFVLTDSFHGTLFSLLFNRPFATTLNRARGKGRLVELLTRVGLVDHLCESFDQAAALARQEVDWEMVNARIEEQRVVGHEFLTRALTAIHT